MSESKPDGPGIPLQMLDDWLGGGGEMSERIRSFDWASHPLGLPAGWSQSLKITIGIMLTSRYAMWLGWGPEFYFFCNDAYLPTVGIKRDWVLGTSARKVWQEIWQDVGPRAESVLRTGRATWDESLPLFLARSGYVEETYHTFSYSPIPDHTGSIGGMLCVVTEETERVIGERRLAAMAALASGLGSTHTEDEVLQTIARNMTAGAKDLPFAMVYLFDRDGAHARLACASGVIEGHVLAPPLLDLQMPDNSWPAQAIMQHSGAVMIDVADRYRDAPLCGPWDRPPRQAAVVPIPQQGQDKPAGFLVAGINPYRPFDAGYSGFISLLAGQMAAGISNARAYDEERRRANALADLDRAKTAFFSNVSHEFRTPLTLMLGPVEDLLAKSHTDLTPSTKGQLELVNRNGLRLLRLVNSLLDFSRIEAGRVQASYMPTDLAAFTAELASVFRSATERAGLQLLVNCQALTEPVYVDRDMWEKIVLNLLSNAFKFTFNGDICVGVRKVGEAAELRVSDTGVGIPAEELPRLFERFHRVEHSRSRTHEGSGIGLALVQELVRLHNGSVRVESRYGEGSTFIVTVPLGTAHLPSTRISRDRALATTATGAAPFVEEALRWLPDIGQDEGSELTMAMRQEILPIPCPPLEEQHIHRPFILVADDNADMRQYIVRLLSERYRVEAAADGEAALRAVRQQQPDLIVSDVMMPNLDGFGLLRELRSHPDTKTIPIILLSARAGEESRVEGLEHGADDYLIKPFSARELLARVDAHVKMAHLRRTAEVEIARSKLLLERIAAATPDMLFVFDVIEGRNIYMNRSLESILGYTIEQLHTMQGDLTETIVHPEDRADVKSWYVQFDMATDGQVLESEHRLLRADGSYCWILARASVFERTPDGRVKQIIGIASDITARKTSEEVLRAHDIQLRFITDTAPVQIAHCDRNGRYLFVNRRYAERFGLRPEQCVGKRIPDIIGEEAYANFRPYVEAALAGESIEFEIQVPHETLGPRYMHCAYVPQAEHDRSIQGFVAVILDITERKQTEIALRHSEEGFRSLASQLEDLVATRTDELVQSQTRLRALATELNLTEHRERTRLAAELHDHLAQMLVLGRLKLGQGKRIPGLVPVCAELIKETDDVLNDALTYTRTMVADLCPPVLREFGLVAALPWLAGQMERYHLDVTVDTNESSEWPILEDRAVLLFQSIRELLINIAKHAQTKRAMVTLRADEGLLKIEVCDEGRGFDPSIRDEAAPTSSKFGLFSIGERMKALGGEFRMESAQGKGTKATLMLPLQQREEYHVPDKSSGTTHTSGALSHTVVTSPFLAHESRRIRILLVDDHAMLRQGLRTIVTGYDHFEVVGEAGSGLEAIRLAGSLKPDVVVMDINMPQLDGIEATKRIMEERHQDIAIIGLSVHETPELTQRMREAGAVAYLTKESAADDLCKVIETAAQHIRNRI